MPKISIIVPIYKVEKYLIKCIESILTQTFNEFELILVNDGSPDNCGEICDNFASLDNRVKVIHKENGGLSSARNAGLDIAIGKYIGFIDSDDYIAKNMYEILYTEIMSGYDIVCCDTNYVNENYEKIEIEPFKKRESLNSEAAINWALDGGRAVISCNKLYKKKLFQNIRFPHGKYHEDEFTTYKLFAKSEHVLVIPEPLYFYLQRCNSIMGEGFSLRSFDIFAAFVERYNFIREGYPKLQKKAFTKTVDKSMKLLKHYVLCYNDLKNVEFVKTFKYLRKNFLLFFTNYDVKITRKFSCFSLLLGKKSFATYIRLKKRLKFMLEKMYNKLCPNKIKRFINKKVWRIKMEKQVQEIRKDYGSCIVFIATPGHGNLGDHAIVYAQYKFFEDLNLKGKIIEFSAEEYKKYSSLIKQNLKEKDLIIIDGGGNMGTLWINEEHKMQKIISDFPHNKIIIFPQTVFYSNDEFGQNELDRSKKIYTAHKHLCICVRDEKSYKFLKNVYNGANLFFTPDIVLYLNLLNKKAERKDAIICLRKDLEKTFDETKTEIIIDFLNKKGLNAKFSSTVVDYSISKFERESELNNLWSEYQNAKIVITDRLHGMIFAAITGTPCIAFDNSSNKVKGVYEQWLKDVDYIMFCDTFGEFEQKATDLLLIEDCNNSYNFKNNFDEIKNLICGDYDVK